MRRLSYYLQQRACVIVAKTCDQQTPERSISRMAQYLVRVRVRVRVRGRVGVGLGLGLGLG